MSVKIKLLFAREVKRGKHLKELLLNEVVDQINVKTRKHMIRI